MPETSSEPPKFNILEALNKEIGKQQKKLLEAQGKKDTTDNESKDGKEKKDGKDEPERTAGKSGPKDSSPDGRESAYREAHGLPAAEESAEDARETQSPEEVIRSLAALRDWLEGELLAHRGGVLESIGRIVDEYTQEPRKQLGKRMRRDGVIVFVLVLGILIGNAVDFYTTHQTLPGWLLWVTQIKLAH